MTQQNEKNLEIALYAGVGIFFASIAFKALAWPHLRQFLISFYNAPTTERTLLIQSLVPFSLDEKKIREETVDDAENLKELVIVTSNTLHAWKQLGLTVSIGEAYALKTLKKHYREKLLSTHPDKTGKNDSHSFLEIRTALKQILEAQTITQTLFSFGKEQLFSIFVVKGEAAQALTAEFTQWERTCQACIKNLQDHINKQDQLIIVQQNALIAEKQYEKTLNDALLRLDNIEEKLGSFYAHSPYQFHAKSQQHFSSSVIQEENISSRGIAFTFTKSDNDD